MKKLRLAVILSTCSVLAGCGIGQNAGSDSQQALNYVKKACIEGEPKLTWQERTNFAAKAFALDKGWNKFYESTSSLAGIDAITENPTRWESASGNDGVQIAYINAKMYAIFYAECNKTGVYK